MEVMSSQHAEVFVFLIVLMLACFGLHWCYSCISAVAGLTRFQSFPHGKVAVRRPASRPWELRLLSQWGYSRAQGEDR